MTANCDAISDVTAVIATDVFEVYGNNGGQTMCMNDSPNREQMANSTTT